MTVNKLDVEDTNFLFDLAEELRRINPEVYGAEADELENIIFRLTGKLNQEEYNIANLGNDNAKPYLEYLQGETNDDLDDLDMDAEMDIMKRDD